MENCISKRTPMEKGFQYNPDSEIIDVPYRQLTGRLIYLSTATRPDIAFSVSYLGRFLNKLTAETWKVGKTILQYLEGTKDMGLTYYRSKDSNLILKSFQMQIGVVTNMIGSVSGTIIFHVENAIS